MDGKTKTGEHTKMQGLPEDTEEHAQLQRPVEDKEEHAPLQGGLKKREGLPTCTRNRHGALSNSAEGQTINPSGCENGRYMTTKDCRSERPDGRMYGGARWLGLLCLILFDMWQKMQQMEELTQRARQWTVCTLKAKETEGSFCTARWNSRDP